MPFRITTAPTGSPVDTETATLFDEYRTHYGQPSDPARTAEWLSTRVAEGSLTLITALHHNQPAGLITTMRLPAGLRLGTFRSIRDLYVAPAHRNRGIARALLHHVITEARAAGDLRVSLQTEPDNNSAHRLYASLGFHQVTDLDTLNLPLTP